MYLYFYSTCRTISKEKKRDDERELPNQTKHIDNDIGIKYCYFLNARLSRIRLKA